MKILVTRPAEDGAEIAQKLAALGHEALLAPLLRIEFHAGPPLDLAGVQAVLATSPNGVRALAARTAARDLPLFAVGPQTAASAEKAGFTHVRNAAGDAVALAGRAAEWADPAGGTLLHVAGQEAPGSLADSLLAQGFQVRRENLYRAVAVSTLPEAAARGLCEQALDAVLFFSPRSAEIFASCVRRAGLETKSVCALCISENTARLLDGLEFREIRVASAPNQDSLLAML